MAIKFTNEQLDLKELAREFFEKEVRPVMAELDARPNPGDCYPRELVRKGSAIGLRTLALPEEYGGVGADVITQTLLHATMAETETAVAKLFSQCWNVTGSIAQEGTEYLKKKFLPEFAKDHDYVCSNAVTEPDSGSDNVAPYNPPPGQGIMMSAVPDGDYYVLNGQKNLVSLASFSKVIRVTARTAPHLPARQGLTLFIVPADLPGISYGKAHNKIGGRLYPNGPIYFDHVRVPKEYMLGKLNEGSQTQAKFARKDLESPAAGHGLMTAMYRICLEHARQRVQGGKVIIQHPTVGSMLAEMAMMIDIQEVYMYDMAQCIQTDPNFDRRKTRFGKIFSRECVHRTSALAIDITASAGIMRDHPLEKLLRDGLAMHHGGGGNSLVKLRVAEMGFK